MQKNNSIIIGDISFENLVIDAVANTQFLAKATKKIVLSNLVIILNARLNLLPHPNPTNRLEDQDFSIKNDSILSFKVFNLDNQEIQLKESERRILSRDLIEKSIFNVVYKPK